MTQKKTEELDFSPFNAEDVLTALCKILRTSRAISFSYAGDIQSLIERIGRVFNSTRCLMFVAAKDQNRVEIFECVNEAVEPVAYKFAGAYGQALALELMGLEDDINYFDDSEKLGGLLNGGYFLPLKIRGEVGSDSGGAEKRTGLLYLKSGEDSRWNKLVLETFVVIADHLACLAQIEQLSSSLKELVVDDKVTGFLHARFAMDAVQKELARGSYFGDQASLILIDLDLGRRSPDIYGTILGESVIKIVASTIATHSRSVDICGRLGLDEFLLFCPRVDEKEGKKLAEHIVKRINESLLNLTRRRGNQKIDQGVFVPTTASAGVAHSSGHGDHYETLFATAREALNDAQANGGNAVKCLRPLDNN